MMGHSMTHLLFGWRDIVELEVTVTSEMRRLR